MGDHAGTAQQAANRRLARWMLLVVVASFGFGFALVPMYNAFCALTGLNGKGTETRAAAHAAAAHTDRTRWVTVEFTGTVMPGLGWQFSPLRRTLRVHPGEVATTAYFARNVGSGAAVGQAVMSVTPGIAGGYIRKVECFCFRQQTLRAAEVKTMPLLFVVSPDLPANVDTIDMSYALFPVDRTT